MKAEQERYRKEEALKKLDDERRRQKVENLQRLELAEKIKEERERLKKLEQEAAK